MKINREIFMVKKLFLIIISLVSIYSCSNELFNDGDRLNRMVLIYMADNNNLSYFASKNYEDILNSDLPDYFKAGEEHGDILLVYTRNRKRSSGESGDKQPELLRVSKNSRGKAVVEVIKRYDDNTNSATAETLKDVLEYSNSLFTAERRGLVLWSHGTGWVEDNQYSRQIHRSFGSERGQEINIPELAEAIPEMYDFVLFDACLMGGVEVMYELKDKARYIIGSATEVMGSGFPYKSMISDLFSGYDFDLTGVCQHYYDYYAGFDVPSATVALINTSALEQLADAAENIIKRDGQRIRTLQQADVQKMQKYFSGNFHWFYDLRDFYATISTDKSEMDAFDAALYNTVMFKLNTEYYYDSVYGSCDTRIESFSGLSTYVPFFYNESDKDAFYMNLAWSKRVGLANL